MKVSIIGQKNTVLLIAQHICRLKEVKELVLVDDVHRISSLALASKLPQLQIIVNIFSL